MGWWSYVCHCEWEGYSEEAEKHFLSHKTSSTATTHSDEMWYDVWRQWHLVFVVFPPTHISGWPMRKMSNGRERLQESSRKWGGHTLAATPLVCHWLFTLLATEQSHFVSIDLPTGEQNLTKFQRLWFLFFLLHSLYFHLRIPHSTTFRKPQPSSPLGPDLACSPCYQLNTQASATRPISLHS